MRPRGGREDALAPSEPIVRKQKANLARCFDCDVSSEGRKKLRRATQTGAPLGAVAWVKALEAASERVFADCSVGTCNGTHTISAPGRK